MASYTTEEEITVTAEIDLEITVQDQDGNEIECDVDGYGFSLTAQIDTQSIKDNMLDDIKDELRDELRDELQEELKGEFKSELFKEIALADNPIQVLSGMLSFVADQYEGVSNAMNAAISTSKTRLADQADEIRTLKHNVVEKDLAIDSQNQVIQKQQVRLDATHATLEKAREEASAIVDTPTVHELKIHIDPPKEDQ